MNQAKNIEAYQNGKVLCNSSRNRKNVEAFLFLGNMYINNKNRETKYSFDDKHWCVYNLSLLGKLRKLLSGDFKIALDCKKSLKVGI